MNFSQLEGVIQTPTSVQISESRILNSWRSRGDLDLTYQITNSPGCVGEKFPIRVKELFSNFCLGREAKQIIPDSSYWREISGPVFC